MVVMTTGVTADIQLTDYEIGLNSPGIDGSVTLGIEQISG